jgi:hypothetical protein
MAMLRSHNPSQYYKSHESIEKSLTSIYHKTLKTEAKFGMNEFLVNPEMLNEIFLCLKDNLTFILKGFSGTGKTRFIESFVSCYLKIDALTINNLDALRFFQKSKHKAIIFDDVNFAALDDHREKVIRLVDITGAGSWDIKHSSVEIPSGILRFICTNRSFEAYLPHCSSLTEVGRRYREYDIGYRKLFFSDFTVFDLPPNTKWKIHETNFAVSRTLLDDFSTYREVVDFSVENSFNSITVKKAVLFKVSEQFFTRDHKGNEVLRSEERFVDDVVPLRSRRQDIPTAKYLPGRPLLLLE